MNLGKRAIASLPLLVYIITTFWGGVAQLVRAAES